EGPGGDAGAGLVAELLDRGMAHARRRRARGRRVGVVVASGTIAAPEDAIEEVVIGIGPVAVVITVRPEGVVENVGIGVGPEDRSVPADEMRAVMMAPGAVRAEPVVAGTRGCEGRGKAGLARQPGAVGAVGAHVGAGIAARVPVQQLPLHAARRQPPLNRAVEVMTLERAVDVQLAPQRTAGEAAVARVEAR